MAALPAAGASPAADRSTYTQVAVLGLCTLLLFAGGAGAAAYFEDPAARTVVVTGNFNARTQADYGSGDARANRPVAPQRALPTPIRSS